MRVEYRSIDTVYASGAIRASFDRDRHRDLQRSSGLRRWLQESEDFVSVNAEPVEFHRPEKRAYLVRKAGNRDRTISLGDIDRQAVELGHPPVDHIALHQRFRRLTEH